MYFVSVRNIDGQNHSGHTVKRLLLLTMDDISFQAEIKRAIRIPLKYHEKKDPKDVIPNFLFFSSPG